MCLTDIKGHIQGTKKGDVKYGNSWNIKRLIRQCVWQTITLFIMEKVCSKRRGLTDSGVSWNWICETILTQIRSIHFKDTMTYCQHYICVILLCISLTQWTLNSWFVLGFLLEKTWDIHLYSLSIPIELMRI